MSGNDPIPLSDPKPGAGSRAAAVVAIALIAGLTVWFVTGCSRDDTGPAMTAAFASDAAIVSEGEVDSLPDRVGHEVFWAGERPASEVEMSDDDAGNIHLRYLTGGAAAGSAAQTFLDVGTYPFKGAFRTTRALTNQPRLTKVKFGKAVGFYDTDRPYSVILAFPSQPDLQIEVYHPKKGGALDVVRSGDIVPVP